MKTAAIFIAANMVAMTAIGFAGALALHSQDGWGWFLLVGALSTAVPKSKDDEKS